MSHFIRSDGHLTDAALGALADKEDRVLDTSAETHLNTCDACLGRLGALSEQMTSLELELERALPQTTVVAVPWRLVIFGGVAGALGVTLSLGDRLPQANLHWLRPSLALLKQCYGLTSQPWFLGSCVALTVVCAAIAHKFSTMTRSQ
jgi:hypothetical protein